MQLFDYAFLLRSAAGLSMREAVLLSKISLINGTSIKCIQECTSHYYVVDSGQC